MPERNKLDMIQGMTYTSQEISNLGFEPTGRFYGIGSETQFYEKGNQSCLLEDVGDGNLKVIVAPYDR